MNKKIVFMGTPMFAVPILKSLYQNGYQVSVVYTRPPQKSNRGQKVNKSPVHIFSETIGLNLKTPISLKNNKEEIDYLKSLDAEIALVVAYGLIIPSEILKLTKKGFINIHASLLPKWRGAAPIQRSIMNLEKETGISIMRINENLDEGPVCNKYKLEIKENENLEDLSNRLSLLASEKIPKVLDDIFDGEALFKEQDNKNSSYAKKIEKSEGKINWNSKAENIIGIINALNPFPGAYFNFNGERYKIVKAIKSDTKGEIGKIISDYFEIGCENGSVKVLEIQRQGKKVQKINEFMLGSKIKKGTDIANA